MEIKRLSFDLVDDYIDFFDHVAFTDNEEWAGCYCVYYHWNDQLEAESQEYQAAGGTCFRRKLAISMIKEGALQGYLAYIEGKVVGWCNANDRAAYEGFSRAKRPELWEDAEGTEKVKSIVCYTIAPDMRQQGIATKLLERICQDAATEGYDFVEAYPGTGTSNVHRNYHGPLSLYEKFGFRLIKELDGEALVRKYFK